MEDHASGSISTTATGMDHQKLGIWALIGSEAVFFSAMITVYLIMHTRSVVGPYPHEVLDVTVTAANTLVLLGSSLTMVTALSAIQRGNEKQMRLWLIVTAALGLVFLAGQAYEFTTLIQKGLTIRRNLFGSAFFTLTGFHGAHVAAGVFWIALLLVRAFTGKPWKVGPAQVELVGLYWHFVDLVWILIFTIVYLLP